VRVKGKKRKSGGVNPAQRIRKLLGAEAQCFRRDQFIKALEMLDEAAELSRGKVKWLTAIFERKVECLYEMRRYRLALALCDSFTGKHPEVAAGYFQRSEILWVIGDHARARRFRNKALRLDPNNGYYHFRAAVHADVMSRHIEAIRCIDRAIRLEPTAPEYWEEKAFFHEHREETPQALECFLKTYSLGNRVPWILFEIADACYSLGRHREALKWVNRALKKGRWDNAHMLKAKALAMLGRKSETIRELFTLLETPGPTYLFGPEWYAFELLRSDPRFQEWLLSLERRNELAERGESRPVGV
jgi:tetratricopeptide (TPR) repeat protein